MRGILYALEMIILKQYSLKSIKTKLKDIIYDFDCLFVLMLDITYFFLGISQIRISAYFVFFHVCLNLMISNY
jgi:hypothetical protein